MKPETSDLSASQSQGKIEPLCPVFGTCGGCAYQDLRYPEELSLKERGIRKLLEEGLGVAEDVFSPIVASPRPYYYRSRLDLTLRRLKEGGTTMGFQHEGSHRVVPTKSCDIAMAPMSDFLPELHRQAEQRLPENYRTANLVVRSGDDERILWGGIGRKSLVLNECDYLWTEIRGKRIYYSLDTFFQANLSILPALMDCIEKVVEWHRETQFFDLYAGVGLFGIHFADHVGQVFMAEENESSCELMRFNTAYHHLDNVVVCRNKVEEELPRLLASPRLRQRVAIIDPPRRGLSSQVVEVLSCAKSLSALLYLSCHPESLLRDLGFFVKGGWHITKVIPFDFFPRTKHLETLVLLTS